MSTARSSVLIIGGGAAGHACARTLRAEGHPGSITIVDGERGPAINRTLVDTGVLPGLLTSEQIALPGLEDVEVLKGRAMRLDGRGRAVTLEDGRERRADAIVLACGSAPLLPGALVSGSERVAVHHLHTASDAVRLREALPEPRGARVAVLGAGFIGTEVASHYAGAGAEVTLLGRSAVPLRAAVGALVARELAAVHREHVNARFGVPVKAVAPGASGEPLIVTMADDRIVEADVVVAALGTRPATAWLGCSDGIPVDDHLRALGFPSGVYAAGGAALMTLGGARRLRVDHWDSAAAQGTHVARVLLHDLLGATDPGAYLPRSGFILRAYGEVIAARGVLAPGGEELARPLGTGNGRTGVVVEFRDVHGVITGVAGFNAGAALIDAAAAMGTRLPAESRPHAR